MTEPSGSAGVKRRDFLKVLGAAGAATSTIGCFQEDVERLIPYLASPDQTVPGVSTYYATTCRECSAGCGVIAETRDGRTIKLEGNPAHPVNRGALCARGQSALQGLYNPDRYREPVGEHDLDLERTEDAAGVADEEPHRRVREGDADGRRGRAVAPAQAKGGGRVAAVDVPGLVVGDEIGAVEVPAGRAAGEVAVGTSV